uniref:AMMECR1 domain-containing protein n=1 Tax=Babesia bovis TaxID=5865 RepID=S6B393_BABBO|nr:conserved hypothetical protein [Babesia bovis]
MPTDIDFMLNTLDDNFCASCFDALDELLTKNKKPIRSDMQRLMDLGIKSAMFVTWMIVDDNGNEQLRGCVGSLGKVSIESLGYYAQLSAYDDKRFKPITAEEVPKLICKVSLLHTYEPAENPSDWEVGKHGVIIKFYHNGEKYSSTYLPEVAEENNLNKQAAINQLIRKAGYRRGDPTKLWKILEVTRYQSKKLKLSYSDYVKLDPSI